MLTAFRWNHLFSSKLFSNTTLSYTDYKYRNLYNYEYQTDSLHKDLKSKITTNIRDYSLKTDFTYYLSPNYEMRFGFISIFHSFIPNNEHYQQSITGKIPIDSTYISNIQATEAGIYAENDFSLKWISANLGARLSAYFLNDKAYYSFEPRVLLNLYTSSMDFLKLNSKTAEAKFFFLKGITRPYIGCGVGLFTEIFEWGSSFRQTENNWGFEPKIGVLLDSKMLKNLFVDASVSYLNTYKKQSNIKAFNLAVGLKYMIDFRKTAGN